MAIVELRVKTWIPQARVLFSETPSGATTWFHGDNRSESWDSMSYRTHQRFRIDTAATDYYVNATKNIGITTQVNKDRYGNTTSTQTAQAPLSDLTYKKRVEGDILYLDCVCHSSNPLALGAPAIDYEFTLKVTRSGHFRVTGKHDGFPGYEVWRKIGDRSPELIWSHDPRETGESESSLFPPMEHSVDANKGA